MNFTIIKAIFRRDFVSYFSNPTGYVFICVFVMLTALAAFWPPEFFSNNLANLDQLSRWMPFILLVFIPAISMSIWAEEKRQGTDELLLTLPAQDFDVVLGKFKAAVAIYTVSLLFSMFSVFLVFTWGLGEPDGGLFLGSYLGYWFVGVAMLSIGMVASFLTSNLTVGFILGMLFNAPLALFGAADLVVKNPAVAQTLRQWSIAEQFADFERGVVSLRSVLYFASIVAVMLYVSMVLISKRHWGGGEDGESKGGHFLVRSLSLLAVVGALNALLADRDSVRVDLTSESLNSLSPRTVTLVKDLGADKEVPPIRVDAYISPEVPAEYAAQKRNLLSTLDELEATSAGKIRVVKHVVENFSEEATLAERTYGIEAKSVSVMSRGARADQEIFLGAAFTCGLDKVVLPFIDKGLPVEYEVVRSITTVAQPKRQRVGVVKTDVQLNGGFSMQGSTPETRLIAELKKQYDVVEVDPTKPIADTYDVLLAVQPSSLGPAEMDHFVAAVKKGQPTAIFEDPFPLPNFWQDVVGTAQPNQPGGGGMMGMFGGGGPPKPKGDINQLWNLLGVRMEGDEVVWQEYNPYPRAEAFVDSQWLFIDEGCGAAKPFNPDEPIVAGLRQVLFLLAGSFQPANGSKLDFAQLAVTGENTGVISHADLQMASQSGGLGLRQRRTGDPYIVAARVSGELIDEQELSLKALKADAAGEGKDAADAGKGEAANDDAEKDDSKATEGDAKDDTLPAADAVKLNVVLVADIDCLADPFFAIREMGDDEEALVDWNFQNVAFVLNALDSLAGDDRFLDVRKRTRQHRILSKIEEATETAREEASKERSKFVADATQSIEAAREEFTKKIAEIEARTDVPAIAKRQMIEQAQMRLGRSRDVKIAAQEKDRDRKMRQTERDLAAKVRGVQDFYKLCAVVLPPIPPILLAFLVFFHRRESEREGVAKSRLRFGRKEDKQT
ncbi:MAG: Gldg family protein [Lacipirellulaceae bacterium]